MKILRFCICIFFILAGTAAAFNDDFEDGNFNGWKPGYWSSSPIKDNAEWSVVYGELYGDSEPGMAANIMADFDPGVTDYSLEAEVSIPLDTASETAGAFQGIFGRAIDQNQYYVFVMRKGVRHGEDFVRLLKVDGTKLNTELGRFYSNIEFDTFYQLRMEFSGPTIRCYFNGQLVIEARDTEYMGTKFGLHVNGGSGYYDNVILESMNMSVDIDNKPGCYPNCFKIKDHGLTPVTALGSVNLDVTMVHASALTF